MASHTPAGPSPSRTDEASDLAARLVVDPHAAYAGLREQGPAHRVTGTDGRPAWLVTRYEDVRRGLADPRLSLDKRHALPGNYAGMRLPAALDANLLNMDPPDHTRIRRLVSQAFTPQRVERLRDPIRRTADALLDAFPAEGPGSVDLVAAYAAPLPIVVICDLLGVPAAERLDFRSWTDALVAPDPSRPELAKAAVGSMFAYLTALIAGKRAQPGDDLLSAMIAARDEGQRLSEDELLSLAFLILFAGYENTVQLIGNAVLALLTHPGQLAALRADRSLLPAAVDELMRFDTPAPLAIRRFPLEDVDFGDVTVPAGETVLLSIASANRDPERFPDPDRLDLDRATAGQLALGHGIHYCLGAPLARVETEIALDALLTRLPRLALAVPEPELRWRPSMRARGLVALPVSY
ncbi:cytochrome P450 family protein [Streptacidiphilus anmyonensis]|uniref:cytochrome P450 family protein n=1 Tax=Streptacidiphilus anmyonensis TaxID=405782 RepID=UPI0005A9B699|nr:cytochrome P450 [Streptacidiphilus anmyonensis]